LTDVLARLFLFGWRGTREAPPLLQPDQGT
jgi:hypothetical protein